ncbi:hypothetical protein [Flaviflagellibacter deserti]|uniref:Flagellar assembly protein FliH/Type III secretion system HrpE domain-containing protein n=1 Tax=Flaviflagellibacter deserti TaxID=2267266 RepID=A0ABV9Z579_9HYPH
MLRSVAHVLADFDVEEPLNENLPPEVEPDIPVEPLGFSQAEETAKKIDEACARIREDTLAEADERLQRVLSEQAVAFTEKLEAERKAWVEEQATILSSTLVAAIDGLETRIADTAAKVLKPFLAERSREKALAELTDCVVRILADPAHPVLAISGPQDLLDSLSTALGTDAGSVAFEPNASADIRVIAGETILETRIQEWVARLDRSGE